MLSRPSYAGDPSEYEKSFPAEEVEDKIRAAKESDVEEDAAVDSVMWEEYESWGLPRIDRGGEVSLDEEHAQRLLEKLNGITEDETIS